MPKRFPLLIAIALLVPTVHVGARLSAAPDTRLLAQPAVSADHVAFVYAGDLWSATLAGADVRRLTTSEGEVSSPAFSPDGESIAFSADYDGNTDVYVVPVGGGAPKRLTWHPGADVVQGFTPDGRSVLFTSARNVFTNRFTQLFTVPLTGGVETPLPIPNAARAAYSGDGRRIAYNPLSPAFAEWKRYRGGRVSTVNVFDVQTHAVEAVAQPQTRANDADPMWLGDNLYFRSDRDGEFNLYSYDRSKKEARQLTRHHDFPVLNASAGGGHIVYEQAGYLHVLEPGAGASRKLTFAVPSDLRETRERFVRGSKWIQSATLSPSGARAAFDFRGDIVTVPAEKGDVRNLTASPGVHERSPVWSPDGTRIAYFSDEPGENQLVVAPQDGKGAPKAYPVEGHGFYDDLVWSPDCQRISYVDNSQSVYWIDLKTGRSKKIASQQTYTPASQLRHAWSPDSKWLVYTIATRPLVMTVLAYSADQDKSFPITDGLAEVTAPAFDRSGKYLYFFGSTDAGPLLDWFSQASSDMRETRNVYITVLRKDLPSPLAKESDEEAKPKPTTDTPEPGDKADKEKKPEAKPGSQTAAHGGGPAETPAKAPVDTTPFRIDLDDIQFRILDVPVPAGELSNLQAGNAGQFYFIRQVEGKPALQRFDLEKRKAETVLPDVADYQVSADGKKLLYRSGDAWFIVSTTKEVKPGEGKIATDAIEVKVNPRAEWNEIFSEAWRVNRDYFYDPGMHGVDWKAARAKYSALLPDVTTRSDLNRVMQWMTSELSVGHHRISDPGDVPAPNHPVPGGLLGADYAVENGRYRFAKVYGGLNWTPQLRSPLTEPGVNVKAGEYLLAVNGRDVRPTANLYSFFENTAGKIVEITVGPNADGSGSRTVQVVPIPGEGALRNRAWVEGNLRKVDKATDGRVAYVYVPNTAEPGHTYFKRYFYPQAHKDAVIVDERFNGGGQVADYYIDILRRPLISYWAMRYGADLKTPTASIQGPKVMIIDETAGSGGDLLPWMFRKLKMGQIVGKRTWGGLVGILGFPDFIDGGSITAPNLAIWTEDGWVVENEGVPPDIEVEQTPADVIDGRDPQLEKAIAIALAELKKNPPVTPSRPPYKKLNGGS
ncbi:MAG TPA: PDZ domain-containing protein [Vicinamibacterales bacterium]|nr:PDZ domain-containing protein [Vicinamibacterales bacterium]